MDWKPRARGLADTVVGPHSRWYPALCTVPRHLFVPRWWHRGRVIDGPSDVEHWLRTAYSDTSMVTEVDSVHADHAREEQRGWPTSSSTKPSLVVRMYRHACLEGAEAILDVGTGSGYGAGVLAHRFGDEHVTSVDASDYLVRAARQRLGEAELHPRLETVDATGPLPGSFDRIVSMVGVSTIPASWIAALTPGGRLVTTLRDARVIITAAKHHDGHAYGRVEWDRAAFMATRGDTTHSERPNGPPTDDSEPSTGRYPVIDVREAWELYSFLCVTCPGLRHTYRQDGDTRTASITHADGSWARATAQGLELPEIRQGGPRRLWDVLDHARDWWITEGELPLLGASVAISPTGTTSFTRGTPTGRRWQATLG